MKYHLRLFYNFRGYYFIGNIDKQMKQSIIRIISRLSLFTVSFCSSQIINAQTVIEMTHPTDADVVLLKVNSKDNADIVVYKTNRMKEAKQWDCMWKFRKWGFSDVSVFLLNDIKDTVLYRDDDYAYQIDGNIFFTENKKERGYTRSNFLIEKIFRKYDVAPPDTVIASVQPKPTRHVLSFNARMTIQSSNLPVYQKTIFEIIDVNSGNKVIQLISDSSAAKSTGEIEPGNYRVEIKTEGYLPYSEQFIVAENDTLTPVSIIRELQSAKPPVQETKINCANFLFDYTSHELKAESCAELDKIYTFLTNNPGTSLEITGHTDSKGSEKFNTNLSLQRAKQAAGYLTSKGIQVQRITVKANSEKNPIARNINPDGSDCPDGRNFNRRNEFVITGNTVNVITFEKISVPDNLR